MMLFAMPCCGGALRPRPGFTLFVVCGVGFLLGMGFWQLERMAWKHDLIARIEARMAAPAEDYPVAIQDLAALEYRHLRVTGRFHHDKELHLAARDMRSGVYGYHILTPLQAADGRWILVSRGWAPPEKKLPETRAEGQAAGMVSLGGVARLPKPRPWMAAANAPERNVWLWLDMDGMAKAAGVAAFAPLYLEADAASNPGGWPRGGQTRVSFPDNHLVYAITWFSLALALAVIWGVKSWAREERV